jgi:histidyl-tRNA synthetase
MRWLWQVSPTTATSAALVPSHPQNPSQEKAKVGIISGFTDYNECQHVEISRWKSIVERVYAQHGFAPFEARPFEYKDFLMQGGIGHQVYGVYRLEDGGTTLYGLPYDHTVPLALFVAQRVNELVLPYKRHQIGVVLRGEKAQAGRFRGFIQADVDIVDRKLSPLADSECIMSIVNALKQLPVGKFVVSLNHMSIVKAILDDFQVPEAKKAKALQILDKMDKLSMQEIIKEIQELCTELQPDQAVLLVDTFSYKGDPLAFQEKVKGRSEPVQKGYQELMLVYQSLLDSGVDRGSLCLNLSIIRGLNYYTGILFETHLVGRESIGSVASGGRYCNLVGDFNPRHKDVEGVGGAIGLTRLFDILVVRANVELKRRTEANLFIGYREESLRQEALQLAKTLREQGFLVDLYTGSTIKIGKQLEYGNRKGIPTALLVMDKASFVLRNMTNSKQQEFATKDLAIQALVSLRGTVTQQ